MDAHISRLVLFMPECTFLHLIYKLANHFIGIHAMNVIMSLEIMPDE